MSVRYVRGVNYLARMESSGSYSVLLYNGHGDVVQTSDENGNIQNSYDYDIWGNPTLTIEQYSCSIRYAGEFFDKETGLYYLRARYYNPYTGRFISEDSYWGEDANPLSLNLYTYCHNDPINYVDPTGRTESCDTVLSTDDQTRIAKLTEDYNAAKKSGDLQAAEDAHRAAVAIRESSGKLDDYEDEYHYHTTEQSGNGSTSYSEGSSGKAVEAIQMALINDKLKRYNMGGYGADGSFGKYTKGAVIRYQIDQGLTYDGIVGTDTSRSLGISLAQYAGSSGKKEERSNPKVAVNHNGVPYSSMITKTYSTPAPGRNSAQGSGDSQGVGNRSKPQIAMVMGSIITSNSETVDLYRAVSEAEYKQLMKTGKFNPGPNGLNAKFFAERYDDAVTWGNKLEGENNFRVIKIQVAKDIANDGNKFIRWDRLDSIGPARAAEYADLNKLGLKIIEVDKNKKPKNDNDNNKPSGGTGSGGGLDNGETVTVSDGQGYNYIMDNSGNIRRDNSYPDNWIRSPFEYQPPLFVKITDRYDYGDVFYNLNGYRQGTGQSSGIPILPINPGGNIPLPAPGPIYEPIPIPAF